MRFFPAVAGFALTVCSTSLAADLAVLRNGNSIRHERKEILGVVTRLYTGSASDGYIEIPTNQIDHFERDTSPPPTPAQLPTSASQRAVPMTTYVNPQHEEALTGEGLNQALNSAGERHQIDPDFLRSVVKAESGFHQNAVSRKGALGLMQLMPETAYELGVSNPFDPNANVEGGTRYLRDLLVKYNFDVNKALAAYNAGPSRVDRYHGVPPYYETQAYIARIIRDFNHQKIAKNPALARKSAASTAKKASQKKAATATVSAGTSRVRQAQSSSSATSIPKGPETASR